ncbi:hypothetical protein BSKO_01167 [Bryopsis sp. KO-2023]|nr:hypothetical protein BSKO_01167 [Bryopsis sp. KO-2023]
MSIGATRNLTDKFRELRNSAQAGQRPRPKSEDRATAKLVGAALNGASDLELGGVDEASVVPDWVVQAERIRTEMGLLKDKINKLKEWHSKALLVSFDTEKESEHHVDVLTQDIKRMLTSMDKGIKRITMDQGGDKVVGQVQRQLAQALFKLSVDFRKEETRFLNKLEEQKGYGKGHFGLLVDEAGASAATGDDDAGFTDLQLVQVSQAESLVSERDEEIRKIVETIGELAQIMKDLSVLVVEQGTILDRIDYNIEQVAEHVEAGIEQLHQAEKSQKQSKSILCIIVLLLLIFVMAIILIMKK